MKRRPKPKALTLDLGKETMQILRLLAAAAKETIEQLVAGWVRERAARELEEYEAQISLVTEVWDGKEVY